MMSALICSPTCACQNIHTTKFAHSVPAEGQGATGGGEESLPTKARRVAGQPNRQIDTIWVRQPRTGGVKCWLLLRCTIILPLRQPQKGEGRSGENSRACKGPQVNQELRTRVMLISPTEWFRSRSENPPLVATEWPARPAKTKRIPFAAAKHIRKHDSLPNMSLIHCLIVFLNGKSGNP